MNIAIESYIEQAKRKNWEIVTQQKSKSKKMKVDPSEQIMVSNV